MTPPLATVLLLAARLVEHHNAGLWSSLHAAMAHEGTSDKHLFAEAVLAARAAGHDPDHDHMRRAEALRVAANRTTKTKETQS